MANLDLSKLAVLASKGAPKVQKITHSISIRRPDPTEWFMVRDGSEWTAIIPIYKAKQIGTQMSDQVFIVTDEEAIQILQEKNAVQFCDVYVLQNRDEPNAYLSVIPLFFPTSDGRSENQYNKTRRACYEIAKREFVQMSNQGNQTYATTVPETKFADPVWPANLPDLKSYLDIGFDQHVIDSKDHPVILRLLGKMCGGILCLLILSDA